MQKGDLLPCPFCECTVIRCFEVFGSGRYRVDCNLCNGGFEANNRERAVALWNRRSDRAGRIAGLKEAAGLADEHAADGANLDERSALLVLAQAIRARIAALETEEGKS
ncbi:hypothetical protein EZH22_24710 [Xanthobacter dioxanivorans]|uniref:Restriction alleviation protein, Lar family n=1 Tax=Xanthobacter dioxanivorans TaxID=2528964 RepID=A0A974PMW5_9HYPH|nr:Lar family restriction alleviation protein [Xanthobacter dioxanivorans]QRG06151.1 hypothetical protein EZH22_24710 [Xanthobacter dioxanivorans]